jgi:hypothetical protein
MIFTTSCDIRQNYYIIPLQKGYPSYKATFFITEVPLYYYIIPLQKGYPSYKATFFITEVPLYYYIIPL